MEMLKLGDKERKILLDILGFDKDGLRCQFCDKKIDYENCFILPPVMTKKKATILDSIVCFSEYLGLQEREGREMKHKWKIEPRGRTTKYYVCLRCGERVSGTSKKRTDEYYSICFGKKGDDKK
jgi:hypothetical protein